MYHYSKEDIQERTGLTLDFINFCNSRLADLLEPFRIKGDKNKILYDDNGLQLWDVVKRHKEQGANIRQIRKALVGILKPTPQTNNVPPNTPQTEPQNTSKAGLLPGVNAFDLKELIEAISATARVGYEHALEEARGNIKLLEEGKEKREKREKSQQEEIQSLKAELWDKKESARRNTARRADLVSQLDQLQGKWGKGKERKQIIADLKNLGQILSQQDV